MPDRVTSRCDRRTEADHTGDEFGVQVGDTERDERAEGVADEQRRFVDAPDLVQARRDRIRVIVGSVAGRRTG